VFNSRGFSLIEVLVAIVVGAIVVIGVGLLGERLVHHRATSDSNSAAMSLAERQMEQLLADPTPNPTGGACPAANLCGAAPPVGLDHTLTNRNVDLTAGGPYTVQWNVVNNDNTTQTTPLKLSSGTNPTQTVVKTIRVTVMLPNDPLVRASITRHYRLKPS
jgi:prepilin-type N-terminal cleavage/methylation domain-containing protein